MGASLEASGENGIADVSGGAELLDGGTCRAGSG